MAIFFGVSSCIRVHSLRPGDKASGGTRARNRSDKRTRGAIAKNFSRDHKSPKLGQESRRQLLKTWARKGSRARARKIIRGDRAEGERLISRPLIKCLVLRADLNQEKWNSRRNWKAGARSPVFHGANDY